MGDVKDLLQDHIYPRMDVMKVFDDLEHIKRSSNGIIATCPSCMQKGKFSASSDPKYPFGRCYRASCGHSVSWWDYTKERYGLDSNRAVLEKLAEMANFQLPEFNPAQRGQRRSNQAGGRHARKKTLTMLYKEFYALGRAALASVNDVSGDIDMQSLMADNYLVTVRKWPDDWMGTTRELIAYPGAKSDLLNYFLNEGFDKDVLYNSGLFRHGWGENYNLLISYADDKGSPAAFVGVLHPKGNFKDGTAMPKYMGSKNISGQSSYKSIPFGLSQAKHDAQKKGEIIFVEGYFDQMMFSQSGFRRCVATGTNKLTSVQAEFVLDELPTVRRYIFALDGDVAGKTGVIQSVMNVLSKKGGDTVSFFVLPTPLLHGVQYKDFDDARKDGGFTLDDGVFNPMPLYKWLVEHPVYGTETEYQKDKNLDVFAGVIDKFPDRITEPLKSYMQVSGVNVVSVLSRTASGRVWVKDVGPADVPAKKRKVSPEGVSSGKERVRQIDGYRRLLNDEESYLLLEVFVRECVMAARENDLNKLGSLSLAIVRRKDLDKKGAGRRATMLANKILKAKKKWEFKVIGQDIKAEAMRIINEKKQQ